MQAITIRACNASSQGILFQSAGEAARRQPATFSDQLAGKFSYFAELQCMTYLQNANKSCIRDLSIKTLRTSPNFGFVSCRRNRAMKYSKDPVWEARGRLPCGEEKELSIVGRIMLARCFAPRARKGLRSWYRGLNRWVPLEFEAFRCWIRYVWQYRTNVS
jgi:hypothetical protein